MSSNLITSALSRSSLADLLDTGRATEPRSAGLRLSSSWAAARARLSRATLCRRLPMVEKANPIRNSRFHRGHLLALALEAMRSRQRATHHCAAEHVRDKGATQHGCGSRGTQRHTTERRKEAACFTAQSGRCCGARGMQGATMRAQILNCGKATHAFTQSGTWNCWKRALLLSLRGINRILHGK